jgi:hypothetical protein
LVTPGDQRDAGGGADCGIGIGLREAHSLGGDAVDIGRREIAAAIAGDIGIAEIIGENEKNVRSGCAMPLISPSSHSARSRMVDPKIA